MIQKITLYIPSAFFHVDFLSRVVALAFSKAVKSQKMGCFLRVPDSEATWAVMKTELHVNHTPFLSTSENNLLYLREFKAVNFTLLWPCPRDGDWVMLIEESSSMGSRWNCSTRDWKTAWSHPLSHLTASRSMANNWKWSRTAPTWSLRRGGMVKEECNSPP